MSSNLINTWINAQGFNYGWGENEALEHLNTELGTNYKPFKINKWRNEHSIPEKVKDYMLVMSMPYVLHEIGLSVEECYESANKVIQMIVK